MGREVRRVPKDWQHPKDKDGHDQPMFDESFREAAEHWLRECILWSKGKHPDQQKGIKDIPKYYWQWDGEPPDEDYYRPEWPEEERTHIQMYETCSEGTPISPVMETPEELAKWLTDNNASAFGGITATYEQWLATIKRGSYISAIYSPEKGLQSGVEFGV
ncbi:hypothetical protein LCGC14_2865960 [marine sediment metagenome]|uniref:Uncharacterized protein n=1 Tax=marine sediment metagenome TaxID=412755 RepID=A0A0F9ACH8_9ZZZZ